MVKVKNGPDFVTKRNVGASVSYGHISSCTRFDLKIQENHVSLTYKI